MKISGSDTASSTDVQQPVGVKISCKNLTATEEFKCSVSELYRALTDREVCMYVCILQARVQPTLDPYAEAFL